jgi:hypothetical protein
MLFNIPSIANWNKIGDHNRQSLTDRNDLHKNKHSIDYDYKVRDNILIVKDGILCKAESKFSKDPCTDGTIRVQCGRKSEWINIRRVTSYTDNIVL